MKHAIYRHTRPVGFKEGKWIYETSEWQVRVMATAEGYAMVRRPRAHPIIVREKELRPLTQGEKP